MSPENLERLVKLERVTRYAALMACGAVVVVATLELVKNGRRYRDTLDTIAAAVTLGAELERRLLPDEPDPLACTCGRPDQPGHHRTTRPCLSPDLTAELEEVDEA